MILKTVPHLSLSFFVIKFDLLSILAKDPYYFMPSMGYINIKVNLPPSGGSIHVTPDKGIGLLTVFTIKVSQNI